MSGPCTLLPIGTREIALSSQPRSLAQHLLSNQFEHHSGRPLSERKPSGRGSSFSARTVASNSATCPGPYKA